MKTLKVKVKDDSTSIKVIEPASYKKAIIIANGAGANFDIKKENIVLSGKSMGGRVASTIFQESKCKKLTLEAGDHSLSR